MTSSILPTVQIFVKKKTYKEIVYIYVYPFFFFFFYRNDTY